MGKDVVDKKLVEYRDVFADIYNNLYFEGKEVIREEELIEMPTMAYTRDSRGNMRGRMCDVRKNCIVGGEYQIFLCCENQTGIDNTMPIRMMGYEYAGYEEQIDCMIDWNKKSKRDAGSRRIYSSQKLKPIISCVLYYGDAIWKTPLRLYDMIDFPAEMPEEVQKQLNDYSIHLIQVAHLTEEERGRLKSDFRIIAEYLAYKNDKEKWENFIRNSDYKIRHVTVVLDVLWEISKDERFYELIDWILEKDREKEEWKMCEMLDEIERIGVEKGLKEGLKEGLERGPQVQKYIQESVKRGLEQKTILEELMREYSVSKQLASAYYEVAMGS